MSRLVRQLSRFPHFLSHSCVGNTHVSASNFLSDLEEECEQLRERARWLEHYNIPASASQLLVQQKRVQTESYDWLCVLACKVTNIDENVRYLTPDGFINLLHTFYSALEQLLLSDDIYKESRASDTTTYIVGIKPEHHSTSRYDHLKSTVSGAKIATKIMNFKDRFNSEKLSGINTSLRVKIGLSVGAAVTGVLRSTVPQFVVVGRAAEDARSMCDAADPDTVRLTYAAYRMLRDVVEVTVHETQQPSKVY